MADTGKEFIRAAKKGDVEGLRSFLQSDSTLLEMQDSDGSTALHCATWKGHVAAVTFLIESGANVLAHNQNDHWGTTPLHAAAHANQAAIAELLIRAGADVKAVDMNGRSPLEHTLFHKATAAAKILKKYGAE